VLKREIFYSQKEGQVVKEKWRVVYKNTVRPYLSLVYTRVLPNSISKPIEAEFDERRGEPSLVIPYVVS
jgi:hypothetical protein